MTTIKATFTFPIESDPSIPRWTDLPDAPGPLGGKILPSIEPGERRSFIDEAGRVVSYSMDAERRITWETQTAFTSGSSISIGIEER